jgi:hypothetical protein
VHRQVSLIDQAFGEVQALGMCDRQRGRPDVFTEQAAKVTTGNAETSRKLFDRAVIQRTIRD